MSNHIAKVVGVNIDFDENLKILKNLNLVMELCDTNLKNFIE